MARTKKNGNGKSEKTEAKTRKPRAPRAKRSEKAPKTEVKEAEVVQAKTIKGMVTAMLKEGFYTKKELAEAIIKSGLTTIKEPSQMIKHLNIMFFKMRKRQVPLVREDRPKDTGGTAGYFHLDG